MKSYSHARPLIVLDKDLPSKFQHHLASGVSSGFGKYEWLTGMAHDTQMGQICSDRQLQLVGH